jgi:hypothetical protein
MSGVCYGLQYRLLLWRRRGWEVAGDRIWENLGRYSGWMCTGSVAGVLAFAMRMHAATLQYESQVPSITGRERYDLKARSYQYISAFSIFYSLQFLCAIFAMNMLLRRVSDHASHRSPSHFPIFIYANLM